MFVELHILQNFAPSCLNRDDTNSPKDCEFGGCRRARISSQCLKRSIRWHPDFAAVTGVALSNRTKLVVQHIAEKIARSKGMESDRVRPLVRAVVEAAFAKGGSKHAIKFDAADKPPYLLFLGRDEIARFQEIVEDNWDALWAAVDAPESLAKEAQKFTKNFRLGSRSPDLALFGRMIADAPEWNVDAACQVAHAISTHRVSMEMDFYTAVDDLQPHEEPGAGMMGVVEFDSACFYRYAVVDIDTLTNNLEGDRDLAVRTVDAFLRAAVAAIPSGKQNSMAAHNPPSFVLAVVKENSAPYSLANAFLKPVWVAEYGETESLMTKSMLALDDYWTRLSEMYGDRGILARPACWLEKVELPAFRDHRVSSVEELYQSVQAALQDAGDG